MYRQTASPARTATRVERMNETRVTPGCCRCVRYLFFHHDITLGRRAEVSDAADGNTLIHGVVAADDRRGRAADEAEVGGRLVAARTAEDLPDVRAGEPRRPAEA